jgi:hypothetical protein
MLFGQWKKYKEPTSPSALGSLLLVYYAFNFRAFVVPTLFAHAMGKLRSSTLRAIYHTWYGKFEVGATFALTSFRSASKWYCHTVSPPIRM